MGSWGEGQLTPLPLAKCLGERCKLTGEVRGAAGLGRQELILAFYRRQLVGLS